MNNKKILFLLIALLIYINVYLPLAEENKTLKQKIIATEKSIQKDYLYLKNKNEILQKLDDANQTLQKYLQRYFYNVKDQQVFSVMQKEIKKEIKNSKVTEDSIKWGESYQTEEFKEFPISIRVYGSIKNLGNFFDSLQNNSKIHIKSFIVRYQKKFYIMDLQVYGLKQDDNV